MALLELSMITSAIVEMSVEATAKKLSRQETVIKTLKHLKIEKEPPHDDFDVIYAYSLVLWTAQARRLFTLMLAL